MHQPLQWVVVIAIAAYLAYVTGRHHLLRTPTPVLELTVIGPGVIGGVLGWWLWRSRRGGSHGHQARRINLSRTRGLVAAGAAIAAGLVMARLLSIHPVHLAMAVFRDVAPAAIAAARHRFFGLPAIAFVITAGFAGLLAAVGAFRWRARGLPWVVLAAIALGTMALDDLVLFASPGLRDLRLDLNAGAAFVTGSAIYLGAPLANLPADPASLPFLYPPITLPIFAALAELSFPVVALGWVSVSVACAIASVRLFGVPWKWTLVLLAWPAFAEGVYVGNVAVPALLLFALGARRGATLVLAGIFKLQDAIPALWLLTPGRRRGLVIGVAVVLTGVLLTLPLTGIGRWTEWIAALGAFRESQVRFPGLYGLALPGFLPYPVFVGLAIAVIGASMLATSVERLRRLGVAAVVASPSLYPHGFTVALPAFLDLETFWLWAALALTSTVLGGGWWAAILIVIASWFMPAMRRGPGGNGLVETDGAQSLASPAPRSLQVEPSFAASVRYPELDAAVTGRRSAHLVAAQRPSGLREATARECHDESNR